MDFWLHHDWFVLICLAIFPRLTLFFGSFISGGLFWWLGWFFAPHLLVAILAIPYWDKNPELVILAWFIALGGSGVESKIIRRLR